MKISNLILQFRQFSLSNRNYLTLLFITSFSILAFKAKGEYISPWDEMYHLSYIQYLYQGHIPRFGDTMNSWSRTGFSCNPVYPFGMVTQIECGTIGEAYMYPEGGTNTASVWPPIFYAVVAFMMKIFLPLIQDPILTARLICAALWTLGVTLIAWTLIKKGIDKSIVFATSLILCSLQFAVFNGAFITPHSSIPLLVGAFLIIGFKVIESRNLNWKTISSLLLFGILVTLVVPHAITLPLILATWVGIFFLHKILIEKKDLFNSTSLIFTALLVPVIGYLINGAWNKWQYNRIVKFKENVNIDAISPSVDPGFGGSQIVEAFWKFLPHSIDGYQFLGPRTLLISQIWAVLALSGLVAITIYVRNFKLVSLAMAIGLIGVISSIGFEYILPINVPPRYGLSIGVLLIATLPFSLVTNRAKYLFLTITSFTVILSLTFKPFLS